MEKNKHPLIIWLKKIKRPQVWLAAELGVHRETVKRQIEGGATLQFRLAIQAMSGGDLMASDWPEHGKLSAGTPMLRL